MAAWAADVLQFGLLGWFAILLGTLVVRGLRGDLRLAGVLTHQDSHAIDPERVQSLAVFAFVIGAYALEGMEAFHAMAIPLEGGLPASMPDISDTLLVLLMGSNGVYLAGKIARSL
ncbi:hypothetical protein [Ancylobacter radicis]|uniref:Uncharacterized protein n=1 Tax=Ancylobacter radicis TaxID=2836179 RepID=A0ABS5RAC2_9HYPH|nr:hypothetical protein [Ancylobacter radicis]MBS9478616.1 hypothetical protein [Ancylobacter radicis]